MKILKVNGKNLASLGGEFEIDFTAEPLASAGIFAITGNTGSGKSTILDAICLALYDCTPRMNKAKETNVLLTDVSDKGISQSDSRSILRRGTAEGYAQVEFIASTGAKYRSTWSVRRAGNKPTGALQKVEISATNIDTGQQLQGTKTEILSQIIQLVGLSFEQFSRSVLLAQGDFATFLKAKQGEKAEILEKLTGTEIYSSISTAIYSKAKEADMKKKELLQHIQDVEVLSEEEKTNISKEREEKKITIETINKDEEKCRQSIKWIDDYQQLITSLNEAQNSVRTINKEIEDASERYEKVAIIDSAQAVRNVYVQQSMAKRQIADEKISLKSEKIKLTGLENELIKAAALKDETQKKQKEFYDYAEKMRPKIDLAKKLDVQLEEQRRRYLDISAENKKLNVMLQESKSQIKTFTDKITTLKTELEVLDKWFEHYQNYSSLVPAKELVTNLLSNYYDSKSQIVILQKTQQEVNQNIETYDNKQKLVQQESERLSSLQPSEVFALRNKLEEGKPCPVCGSIHHPLTDVANDNAVKEEELERRKEEIAKEIDRIAKVLENYRNEQIRLKSSIDSYETQSKNSLDKVMSYVSILPNWNDLLEKGTLKDVVEKFVKQWNSSTEALSKKRQEESTLVAGLNAAGREISNLNNQVTDKVKMLDEADASFKSLQEQRAALLEGKSCAEVQKDMSDKKNEIDKRAENAISSEHTLKIGVENGKTKIGQIETLIKKDEDLVESAQKEIGEWLSYQHKISSFDELNEVFSKDESWLTNEKAYLSSLNERDAALKAVLKERELKIKEHEQSSLRPQEKEERDSIQKRLELNLQEKTEINKALAQIDVLLDNDEKNKKRLEGYSNEYEKNRERFEAWSNLNDMFGSQSGNKFKEIAQEYTLDILVMYANNHLKELAPRYKLERIQDTLALQIVDLDMMGEKRSVHSLSGGESFLVSLALALGLSSISSNRMNVESLFIDEGFGSLDIDTLRIAMDALECLQMQGRKIGVISHVSEMTERISARIQVTKEGSGRSIINVV